jgi:hypothetical protein
MDSNIEFHKKQIRLVGHIITGMEADRELCDLICSQLEPGYKNMDAILDHRNNYPKSIKFYQELFFESKQALEAAGLDWIDYVETPEKETAKQLEWEKRLGIHRLNRWQYFWRRLFSNQWKRIN